MKVEGKDYRTIWLNEKETVSIIDQRYLPHIFQVEEISNLDEMVRAIRDMHVRGAGLIGAAAGYGIYLAIRNSSQNSVYEDLQKAATMLIQSRPTAVNLEWAVKRQIAAVGQADSIESKVEAAKRTANEIADEDADFCYQIGLKGLPLIEAIAKKKNGGPVNILTHCNAGWLAFVDNGSATAPIYAAWKKGINIHVWVDETRPRNQGASLTAWELLNMGIPHTVIADNTGGHLMQHGMVDLVITGADRVTKRGDAANKIGTYLKALAASDNQIPFYIAFPSSTFDWNISDGILQIPIEERSAEEVSYVSGFCDNEIKKVRVIPEGSPALNYGFDVTPARLITGLITERGICRPEEKEIFRLFPEKNK